MFDVVLRCRVSATLSALCKSGFILLFSGKRSSNPHQLLPKAELSSPQPFGGEVGVHCANQDLFKTSSRGLDT
jgi:hypothetical protein